MDDAPSHLLALAEGLLAAGHQVQVVSALWSRSWPRRMFIAGVPLVRLAGAPRGAWSTLRWMDSLGRWLRQEHARLDGVLVAGLRHEAYLAIGRLQPQRPVVAIAYESDLSWHRSAAFGSRIAARCRQASGIVAGNQTLAQMLADDRFPRDRVRVIRPRVSVPSLATQQQRALARAALTGANHDLLTTDAATVALAVGRLDEEHRFGDLVRAWRIVAARRPEARLWIVGDGPLRERLYRQVGDLDLRFRVLLPGTFDSLNELWQAADMVMVPAAHAVPPRPLLQAMAAGLPVIAAEGPGIRDLVVPEKTGVTFPPGDVKALAAAIERLIDRPAEGRALGIAGRQQLQAVSSETMEADEYARLFHELRNQQQAH